MRTGFRAWLPLAPIGAWLLVYPVALYLNHYTLRTNGFDLSVFDYALWSTLEGRVAFVPFMGHSLFAHHVMPSLFLLLPGYLLWPGPAYLIAVQLVAVVVAALLLWRLASDRLPPLAVGALVLGFLFSRRSHSAITSVFYVEALEPALVFGLAWAAWRRQWRVYGVLLAVALGCKEDMAVYLAAFGFGLAMRPDSRRVGIVTTLVSLLWLGLALGWAIPAARQAADFGDANPFIAGRYGEGGGLQVVAGALERVVSWRSAGKLLTLTSAVAFTAWAAPEWLMVAMPGVLLNLAARPGTEQAAMSGHYLWPILPWLFIAAVRGSERVYRWQPRAAPVLMVALCVLTAADSPLRQMAGRAPWRDLAATAEVLRALEQVPRDADLLAQPNLIPHLPHRFAIRALGRELAGGNPPSYVLICGLGDTWPLDGADVRETIRRYARDPDYELRTKDHLTVFARRQAIGSSR